MEGPPGGGIGGDDREDDPVGDDTEGSDATDDPHGGGRVVRRGPDLEDATAAVLMCHGRGASAEAMVDLAERIGQPGVAYLAPQAAGYTWYPYSFLAPVEDNEPHLSSALSWLDYLVAEAAEAGVEPGQVLLMGFSQGACLASEYAARNARRYGGVAALSGGLVGPEGTSRDYDGDFEGTPVFLGCSDRDPHIPEERVHETAAVFEEMGADVDERIYPEMGHVVNADEIEAVDAMVADLVE